MTGDRPLFWALGYTGGKNSAEDLIGTNNENKKDAVTEYFKEIYLYDLKTSDYEKRVFKSINWFEILLYSLQDAN